MNREQIISMAREAGFVSAEFWPENFQGLFGCVERFAALVAAAEREEIAKHFDSLNIGGVHTEWVAAAIREREKTIDKQI